MVDTVDSRDLIPQSIRKSNSAWLDVNSKLKQDGKPTLLPDTLAINNSLQNLFSCPVGARSVLFEPTYGTLLHALLHEPLDEQTAFKIRASLIQSIEKWEPRIQLVHTGTYVIPVPSRQSYRIRVQYVLKATSTTHASEFIVTSS